MVLLNEPDLKRHALGGSFFEPTVIADAKPSMKFMKEEIFGPVTPVFKFDTEEEAVRLSTRFCARTASPSRKSSNGRADG